MPWGAAIVAVGALGSAAISSSGSSSAGNTIASHDYEAIQHVIDAQNVLKSDVQGNEAPYTQAGSVAAGGLTAGLSPGGQFTKNFSLADLNVDPGYQFDLQQGNQAVQRSAAAQGTLNSGGTLKSIANYTTGLASNELNNAYNRYVTDQTNQFNRLYSVAGLGQTAAGALNAADTNYANTISNAQYGGTIAAGAAQAAGQVGSANALSNGLTAGLSGFTNPSLYGSSGLSGGNDLSTLNDLSAYGLNSVGAGNSAYDMIQNSPNF